MRNCRSLKTILFPTIAWICVRNILQNGDRHIHLNNCNEEYEVYFAQPFCRLHHCVKKKYLEKSCTLKLAI